MSNVRLIDELIRLGFRVGSQDVLALVPEFTLVHQVKNGLARLTPAGRERLMYVLRQLKTRTDDPW